MINKDFKHDWKTQTGGEISIIETNHFELGVDRDFIELSISVSPRFRMACIQILLFIFRFY